MQVEVNRVQLFIGVEQGSGKNQDNVLLIATPKMRQDTRKWISSNYGKSLTIENTETYESSVPNEESTETDYRVAYHKFICESL